MKKHIFGLTIFSFIVFAAAFVYGIFSFSEITPVAVPQYAPTEKTYCDFKREMNQPGTVLQAVYKVKTNTIIWQGNLPEKDNLSYFHFWVADKTGFGYLDSVQAENVLRDGKVKNFEGRSLNLDKLSPSSNLYLIPDTFGQSSSSDIEYHPKFDKERAIPVTIDYSK